ncbi:MAG: hypothetical protein LBT71_08325 [Azoarcus sp.]|jgi:hypothetical protein|nr:hypothetical protein [Azoarcus sp.]
MQFLILLARTGLAGYGSFVGAGRIGADLAPLVFIRHLTPRASFDAMRTARPGVALPGNDRNILQ